MNESLETGLQVSLEELIGVRSYLNPGTGYFRHAFCVERWVDERDIVLTEGQGFAWIAFTDLPSLDMPSLDMTASSRSDLEYYLNRRRV